MRSFAELYRQLDETTKTNRKIAALREYFAAASPADAAWAVYFLSGRRINRLVLVRNVRQWCAEAAAVPPWLFDECCDAVGDFAETIALLLPPTQLGSDLPLHIWVEGTLQPLARQNESEQRHSIIAAWSRLTPRERLVFNKLVTGAFRVGVSQRLVVRALAEVSGLDAAVIAHRLMGNWEPTPAFYQGLVAEDRGETQLSQPYPFCLAHPLQGEPQQLVNIGDWLIEWKWDGIRAQLIRRQGETFLWSRGEELILDRFPELAPEASSLPDGTVLDGEVVGWKDGGVLPFGDLQRRIGRRTVGKKILADVPARFIAFDLLEHQGRDVREESLAVRRQFLEELLSQPDRRLMLSPRVAADSWQECVAVRERSRERNVEGLMLKRRDSAYGVGRVTGLWWKWKIDPYTIDAVLIYAQRGSGRRASLYTDYTFGVWHEGELVPFAKAYSGLTDEEIREVDRFVRRNALEKFGPVRVVKPELVFELAFENIQRSMRHKSGIAVRFPRMARWRRDKRPEDADSLAAIEAMLDKE